MKNISEILESILDMDNVDGKSKPWLLVREFVSKYNNGMSKPLDALGRPLSKGDLVLGNYVSPQPRLGIVLEIRGGACAVHFTGNPEDLYQMKTPAGDYRTREKCCNMLKITPEIAEMILDVK